MRRMNPLLRTPQPIRWTWIAGIWGGLGLFEATQDVVVMRAEGMHHAWIPLFFLLLLSWIPWAFATPLLMRMARQFPLLPRGSIGSWVRHILACLFVGCIAAGWSAILEESLNPWNPLMTPAPLLHLWQEKFSNQILSSLILYSGILMATSLLDSRERLSRQEVDRAHLAEQLSQAELAALRHQIEPHFLFNALNAVAGLIRIGRSEGAIDMIARLSDFLRHVLEGSHQQEVPLAEEIGFARMYLGIQAVRFADRLRIKTDLAEDLGPIAVPNLILQPLVENAIAHGISRRAAGGLIEIRAERLGPSLKLSVYNDGPPLNPETPGEPRGIGLANVRKRLSGRYGPLGRLEIANQGDTGVIVTVILPVG
jgi:sensor histidine kinase YesM